MGEAERYKDFTNSSEVKLMLSFAVDRSPEASGEDVITAYVSADMTDEFIDAIRAGRVRLRKFGVVGE